MGLFEIFPLGKGTHTLLYPGNLSVLITLGFSLCRPVE